MADRESQNKRSEKEPKKDRRNMGIKSSRYRTGKEPPYPGRSNARGRREYYRKKEAQRKKRAKKRAAVFFTVLAILATVAIVAVFIFRGCSAQNSRGEKTETIAETQPATIAPYTPVTKELPELEDSGEDGYTDGGLYIRNSAGYDIFKGDEKSALIYSGAIAEFRKTLGDDINVYNMVVPNHTAYGLPDSVLDDIGTNAQRDNTTVIYSNYGEMVIPVDVFNEIGEKRNDYIFYNTDNRWTSLGAYQAYTAFAKVAGLEPLDLASLKKHTIKDYLGSYVASTDNEDLKSNPDTISYYDIPGKYKCTVIERNADGTISPEAKSTEMYKTEFDEDEDKLDVFIHGDNPLFVVDNEDKNDGNKLLVVKDTFGSAIVPFLASGYDEVHVIDFRYYDGSVKDYCNKKGIKNVLFLNGIMSANSAAQVNKMKELFS
ncbi:MULTISPECIES: DHHW family protein [unclassified Ruminococcus]|uniref:DHHW family protein n=1 Tax=unclassified Ruminococcus TaxID=2608920 RepID=UPI0021087AF8|nr:MULTISPECIES: DHHW family protein [unclassified Ruminococcus]MCQ4022016.1 hypothetical protein [Ruminococcus sp. zg-924]MCQ4114552.1 hypothetical protein [Ruminococcus sp. zg-921]